MSILAKGECLQGLILRSHAKVPSFTMDIRHDGVEATKTYRKTEGGERTQVGAANIYEPRCLKHWQAR